MYRADSVMMIGGGAAIIAITMLGFIGAYRQHKCMVGMVSISLFNNIISTNLIGLVLLKHSRWNEIG